MEEHLETGLYFFFLLCVIFCLHPFGLPVYFFICLKIICVREQGVSEHAHSSTINSPWLKGLASS